MRAVNSLARWALRLCAAGRRTCGSHETEIEKKEGTLPCRRCDALGQPRDLAGKVMPWAHVNRGEKRESTHGVSGTTGKGERPRTHETHDLTSMEIRSAAG